MPQTLLKKPKFDNLSIPSSSNYVLRQLKVEILSRNWAREDGLSTKGRRNLFEEKPVSTVEFFDKFFHERNYKIQQELMDAIFGTDPYKWNVDSQTFVALWGMGSGKDHTVAKAFAYGAYWLNCLYDPQAYFGKGRGTAIDLVNVCITGYLAKFIFFAELKNVIKNTFIPKSSGEENWFVSKGMDIREGHDLQSRTIRFPKHVIAHSLDSQHHSGVGLNILLAVFDEIGGFEFSDAKKIVDTIVPTQISRFADHRKTLYISFPRSANDFMMVTYESTKKKKNTWRDKRSTWEVNEGTTEDQFAEEFLENPETATRVYKCECEIGENTYFRYKELLRYCINPKRLNPIVGNKHRTFDASLVSFKEWFKGLGNVRYYGHIDLAKSGDDANDACGIALVHVVKNMPVKIDSVFLNKLENDTGINFKKSFLANKTGTGIFVDFALQVRAKGGREVLFQDIIDLFVVLKRYFGFNIKLVTYDGFQSLGEIQRMKKRGIESKILSVDRIPKVTAKKVKASPYDTLKSLVYRGLFDIYMQPIFIRECEELMLLPNGKIDHPERSVKRLLMEKVKWGSKDVSDGVAGATYNAMQDVDLEFAAWWGDMELFVDNIYSGQILHTPGEQEEILQRKMTSRAKENAAKLRDQLDAPLVRYGEPLFDKHGF